MDAERAAQEILDAEDTFFGGTPFKCGERSHIVLDKFPELPPGSVVEVPMEQGPIVFRSNMGWKNDPTTKPTTAGECKPTNPKDAIGSDKMPLHLWPETATVMGTLGLLDGALKYGRANWRNAGIRSSIYVDALRRHINALFEGEDVDPDSGLPHEAHILATAAIMVDAKAAGKLVDDRQYPGGYRKFIDKMTPHVARLKDKHRERKPKHYTIQDGPQVRPATEGEITGQERF